MAEKASVLRTWDPTKDKRIKKRNGWYWARFSLKGTRVEDPLHTKSFALAQRLVDEIESCILLGVNYKKEKELFETAWPDFLADKAKGIKTRQSRESTLKEYIKLGEMYFMPFFKSERIADINEENWAKYVEWVHEKSPGVLLFNHRKYLMGFLSWANRKGKLKEKPELYDPDKNPDKDDEQDGPGKVYTMAELGAMRGGASGPFKLAIYMAQYMGMRSGEITQLNKNRIDLESNIIKLRASDTKVGKGRKVPIHPEVMPLLMAQIKATTASPWLFPNRVDKGRPMDKTGFKKPWGALRTNLGIDGRFHDFKHTFITNALAAKMNPVIVSEIVGTSIKVIQNTYLHLNDKDLFDDLSQFKI